MIDLKISKKYKHKHENEYYHSRKKLLKKKSKSIKVSKFPYKKKGKGKLQGLNKLKLILNIFFNLISLLLFIISYYFYFLSLEKCTKGDDECSRKWDWIKLKIMQFCKSAAIIIFLIILIIYKIISKFHLIHFVMAFIYFYRYSHSVFFFDHGGLNLFSLFFAIFASLIFIIFLKVFVYIFKIK